jgi:hypothetical protein
MLLFLFESTHSVIKAEKRCQDEKIKCKIVPVPRSVSSQCGMSLEIDIKLKERVKKLLDQNKIKYKTFFTGDKEKGDK